jgi:hypothetical protein
MALKPPLSSPKGISIKSIFSFKALSSFAFAIGLLALLPAASNFSTSQDFTTPFCAVPGLAAENRGGASGRTNPNREYPFANLSNDSSAVTPMRSDQTFDPVERSAAFGVAGISGRNSKAIAANSITGNVTYNGNRLPGITMVLSSSGIIASTVTTDTNGEYTFPDLPSDTYTVKPSKTGYTFNPEDRSVVFDGRIRTGINFDVQLYSISGTVTYNDIGLPGIEMSLSGAATASAMTDSFGNYTFAYLLNGDYTVTPSREGYSFSPENTRITITGADQGEINFITTMSDSTYSITGTVTSNGAGLPGITMVLSSSGIISGIATTNARGDYAFSNLTSETYTVTPSKTGYAFFPENRAMTVTGTDLSAGDFTAAPPDSTHSISGTVNYSGEGLANVTMRLSGAASAEVMTDKYGSYAFSNLPNGNYTISPRKAPYAFSDLSVTVSGDDQTRKNIVAAYRGCSSGALLENGVNISIPSRLFTSTFQVTLSTFVSDAQIRYTTNGQNPTASSNLYIGAIPITSTTRLIAAAFVGGSMRGYPSAAVYIKMSSAFQATDHDLPVIILDSYGSGDLPTNYQNPRPFVDVAYFGLSPETYGGSVTLSPTALPTPSVASLAAFHIRGNSSSMFDKKSYRMELRYETSGDRDCPMFGLWEDSDWALIGPFPDKTLIRNNFVYGLGRDMGMQAPRVKLVEVYVSLNGDALANSHYQGVYQLVETIKNSKNRLDLKQLRADDPGSLVSPKVTGGYIFRFEWADPSPPEIECPDGASNCWNYLYVVDPDDWLDKELLPSENPAYLTNPQYLYLQNHVKKFNDAINSANPTDPATGYPAFMDERSFIDTIIINELTRNFDGLLRSQYFYKQRDSAGVTSKIFAGPLWDFDLTTGVGYTYNGIDSTLPSGSFQYQANASRLSQTSKWFPNLINLLADRNSDFSKHFRSRWNALRQPGGFLSDSSLDARITSLGTGLEGAAARNFSKWDILNVSPVSSPPFKTPKTSTWQEQLTVLKTWLHDRAAWLDTQWAP